LQACALAHGRRAALLAMSGAEKRNAGPPPMKPSVLDVICLGGSLVVAIAWRALTGDTDTADRIGLCLLMSWAILQTIRFVVHRPQ
jgi:hypothetical protein